MSEKQPYILSDSAIVELYWARDESAIKYTDQKYRNYLIKCAYNILSDMQDSEECLNDTYLETWNVIPPQRPRILQAFLSTIMRNLAIDKYRYKNRQKSIPPAFTVSMQDLEGWALDDQSDYTREEAQALATVLSAWLTTLNERQRYIFMSRYYDTKPIVEIANRLGVSRSTVNYEIAEIKKSLKSALVKEGFTV